MSDFVLRARYETIAEVKELVSLYHRSIKKEFRVKQNNSNAFAISCPHNCDFTLRFNRRIDKFYYVSKFHEHTCTKKSNNIRRNEVVEMLRRHPVDYDRFTPKDGINLIQDQHGSSTSYSTMRRAIRDLSVAEDGGQMAGSDIIPPDPAAILAIVNSMNTYASNIQNFASKLLLEYGSTTKRKRGRPPIKRCKLQNDDKT